MTLEQIANMFDKNTKPFGCEESFSLNEIKEAARRTRERQAKTLSYGKFITPKQNRNSKEPR